ncbi:MAG: hypothetical protein ACK5KR_05315 [Breznakia sp.]
MSNFVIILLFLMLLNVVIFRKDGYSFMGRKCQLDSLEKGKTLDTLIHLITAMILVLIEVFWKGVSAQKYTLPIHFNWFSMILALTFCKKKMNP